MVEAIGKDSKARDKARHDVETLEGDHPELVDAVDQGRAGRERWESGWSEAMTAAGLPVETLPSEASSLMARNVELFTRFGMLDSHRLGLAKIDAESRQFEIETWKLADKVAADLIPTSVKFDAEAVAETLHERLKAAQAARPKFDERVARIVDLENTLESSREEVSRHRDTLDGTSA